MIIGRGSRTAERWTDEKMKQGAIVATSVFVALVFVSSPALGTVAPEERPRGSGRIRAEIGLMGVNVVLTAVNVDRLTNSDGSIFWGVGQLLVGGVTFGLSFRDQTRLVRELAAIGAISMILGMVTAAKINRPRESAVRVGAVHLSPGIVRSRNGTSALGLTAKLDF